MLDKYENRKKKTRIYSSTKNKTSTKAVDILLLFCQSTVIVDYTLVYKKRKEEKKENHKGELNKYRQGKSFIGRIEGIQIIIIIKMTLIERP
jgi:hypothetical protein